MCLLKNHRLGSVGDLVGHFLTSMGWQAVHKNCRGFGITHNLGIDLIRWKNQFAFFLFPLLVPCWSGVCIRQHRIPFTASFGFLKNCNLLPLCLLKSFANVIASGTISYPTGEAMQKFKPILEQACINETATLFPSPR